MVGRYRGAIPLVLNRPMAVLHLIFNSLVKVQLIPNRARHGLGNSSAARFTFPVRNDVGSYPALSGLTLISRRPHGYNRFNCTYRTIPCKPQIWWKRGKKKEDNKKWMLQCLFKSRNLFPGGKPFNFFQPLRIVQNFRVLLA